MKGRSDRILRREGGGMCKNLSLWEGDEKREELSTTD